MSRELRASSSSLNTLDIWGRLSFCSCCFSLYTGIELKAPSFLPAGKGGDDSLLIVLGGPHSTAANSTGLRHPRSFGLSRQRMKKGQVTSQATHPRWGAARFNHEIARNRFCCERFCYPFPLPPSNARRFNLLSFSLSPSLLPPHPTNNKEICSFLQYLERVDLKGLSVLRVCARAPVSAPGSPLVSTLPCCSI